MLTDGELVIAIVSHTREPAEQWASDSSDSSLDGGSGSEPEDPTTSTTELEERFLEVKHIITCLYKLSIAIQNPASRDRLQRCAKIEVDHYEYFDIAHASQKFPFAEQYLVDRLGKANTKRRQLFQYHEQHHDKIALYIDAAIDPELDQQDTRGDGLDGGALEADVDPALKIECPTAGIVTIAKTANTQTTVSTFVERSARQAKGSDTGRSQTSYATSVGDDTDTKLRIPAPPGIAREFDGEPFECPYCFSMTAVVNSRSWMYASTSFRVTCAKTLFLGNTYSGTFVRIFARFETAPSPTASSKVAMNGSTTKSSSIAASGSVTPVATYFQREPNSCITCA